MPAPDEFDRSHAHESAVARRSPSAMGDDARKTANAHCASIPPAAQVHEARDTAQPNAPDFSHRAP